MSRIRNTGFPDPWHFNTDADPWIRCTTLRIRIQPLIRILLINFFSFFQFQDAQKKDVIFQVFWLITYSRYFYIQIRITNTDPNPEEPNKYGSESTTLIFRKYGNEVTDLMMLKTSTLPPKISRHEALLYIPSETCGSKKNLYNCRKNKVCDLKKKNL